MSKTTSVEVPDLRCSRAPERARVKPKAQARAKARASRRAKDPRDPAKGKGKGKRNSKSRPSVKPCDADGEESEEEVWDEGQEEEYEDYQEPEEEEGYPEEAARGVKNLNSNTPQFTLQGHGLRISIYLRVCRFSRVENTQTGRASLLPWPKVARDSGSSTFVEERLELVCRPRTLHLSTDEEGIYWSRQPPIEWMLLDSGATHQVTYLPLSLIPKGAKPVKVSLAAREQSVQNLRQVHRIRPNRERPPSMRSELTPAWEVRPDLQTAADVEGEVDPS